MVYPQNETIMKEFSIFLKIWTMQMIILKKDTQKVIIKYILILSGGKEEMYQSVKSGYLYMLELLAVLLSSLHISHIFPFFGPINLHIVLIAKEKKSYQKRS